MFNYLYELVTGKRTGLGYLPIKIALFTLSLIYGLIIRITMFICRLKQYRAGCKVISVGNITVGGTGKTPLVEYITCYLKAQGHKVAIVSRGYKGADEPAMLKEKFPDIPVIVNKNRKEAIEEAIQKYNVDTVVLDDAFQQWKIKKDLEIVAIDAACPFGNRLMLPAGILRQPPSSLRYADIFVLTKTEANPDTQGLKGFLEKINPLAIIAEAKYQPLDFPASQLKGKTAAVFSGIAKPESFEGTIRNLGIDIGLCFRFPDHYNYTQEDLDKIFKAAKEKNIETLITTEKDAARLNVSHTARRTPHVMVLRIGINIIKNEERFLVRLSGMYRL